MKSPHYYLIVIASLMLLLLAGCSSGPAEKPLPDAISSPLNLLNQGVIEYSNSNYLQAIDRFEKALLQYRSIDNQNGIAKSCMNIAKSFMAINYNQLAEQYLDRAEQVITQSSLDELKDHLHLLKSSLAINKADYELALEELQPVLTNADATLQLAALKNQTRIAFITNDKNKQQRLDAYRSLQQAHADSTPSHQARILRFEAELQTDIQQKTDLLSRSLDISRQLAKRPAIAATLVQWADLDASIKNFTDAEDKYLRALFIRHHLGDVQNTRLILDKLQAVYKLTGNEKLAASKRWLESIDNDELTNWPQLILDFENYPMIR